MHWWTVSTTTSVPYTLQEDVESDGNQLASGDLVCNEIYTSTGLQKPLFYVDPYKNNNV